MQIILSCQADLYGRIDTSNVKIHPLVMILSIVVEYGCLVQIFTTRGVVAPPANNLIMLGTLK